MAGPPTASACQFAGQAPDAVLLSQFGADPTGRSNSAEALAAALRMGRSVVVDETFLLANLQGNAFTLAYPGQRIVGRNGILRHDGSLCNLIVLDADRTGVVGALQIVGAEAAPTRPAQAIRIGTGGHHLSGVVVGDGHLKISGFGQGGIGGDSDGRLDDCRVHAEIDRIGWRGAGPDSAIYACDIKPAVGGAVAVRGRFECSQAAGGAALKLNNFRTAIVEAVAVNGDQGACQFNAIRSLIAKVSILYGALPGYALSLNGVEGGRVDFDAACASIQTPVLLGDGCRTLVIAGRTSGTVQTLDNASAQNCRITVQAENGILLGNLGASFTGSHFVGCRTTRMIVSGDDLVFDDNITEGATASSATAGLRINGNRARIRNHVHRRAEAAVVGIEIDGDDVIIESLTHDGDNRRAVRLLPGSRRLQIGAIREAGG